MKAKHGNHLFSGLRACIAYCFLALIPNIVLSQTVCYEYSWQPAWVRKIFTDTSVSGICSQVASEYQRYYVIFTYTVKSTSDDLSAVCYLDKLYNGSHSEVVQTVSKTSSLCNSCLSKKGNAVGPGYFEYPVKDLATANAVVAWSSFSNGGKISTCESGCMVTGDLSFAGCDGEGSLLKCFVSGTNAKYSGETCTTGDGSGLPSSPDATNQPLPKTEVPPAPCPVGQCWGEINNQRVCKPCSATASGTKTTEKYTNENGSPKPGEPASSAGNKETTKVTNCSGGSCNTTTITNVNGGKDKGGTTETKEEKKSQADHCKENPQDKANCGGKSSFSGTCGGAFKAQSDDAVLNAMAEEQYRRNCQMLEEDKNAGSEYNRAASGNHPDDAKNLSKNASQIGIGSFDQSGWGWSRSCPADPVFAVPQGQQFTMPFSNYCGILGILSNAGVAITLLVCMMWVFGGKKD